jgi:YD repeat-containing protein
LDKEPDLTTPSSLVTKNAYAYTDTALALAVQKTSYLNSATSTNSYSYQDGLNRTIQTRTQANGNNTYIVKDSVFDNRGLLQKESLPYFASSTARTSATSTVALYTNYTYDALSRPTQISNAVGTTTNTYANWKITTTDANGKLKDSIKDGFGNLLNVVEHLSTGNATTTYSWDGKNNLLGITDAMSNVRNFTYDGLNRQLTAQDLHASGDATYGSYTYVYDDTNNLTQKVDPKSQTINYTYDALNRVLTEDYTGSGGTEVTYVYDTGTYGKGRLSTASSTDAKITNTYNALGGIKISTTTVAGTSYATTYDYDRQGNQTTITYPDSSQVSYIYSSAGLLDKTLKKESGETLFSNVVSSTDYSQ